MTACVSQASLLPASKTGHAAAYGEIRAGISEPSSETASRNIFLLNSLKLRDAKQGRTRQVLETPSIARNAGGEGEE